MTPPSPADFLTVREFLAAWFRWRQGQGKYSFRDFGREAGETSNLVVLSSVTKGARRCTKAMLWRWRPVLNLPELDEKYLLQMGKVEEAEEEVTRRRRFRKQHDTDDSRRQETIAEDFLRQEQAALGALPRCSRTGTTVVENPLFLALQAGLDALNRPVPPGAPARTVPGYTTAVGPETRDQLLQEIARFREQVLAEEIPPGPVSVEVQVVIFPLTHPCPSVGAVEQNPGTKTEDEPDLYVWGQAGDEGAVGFLRAWFDWKKREEPGFTYEKFAKNAGHPDRGILYKVLHGGLVLTPLRARQFAVGNGEGMGMGMTEEELLFFLLILERDRSKTPQREQVQALLDRNRAKEKIRRLPSGSKDRVEGILPFLLKELACCPSFQEDLAWMAGVLAHPVPLAELQRERANLLRLGWAHDAEYAIDGAADHSAMVRLRYHQAAKSYAIEAFDPASTYPAPRAGYSLRVCCSAARSAELHERVNQFSKDLQAICAAATEVRDQVMQLNFHVWEVTPEERGS